MGWAQFVKIGSKTGTSGTCLGDARVKSSSSERSLEKLVGEPVNVPTSRERAADVCGVRVQGVVRVVVRLSVKSGDGGGSGRERVSPIDPEFGGTAEISVCIIHKYKYSALLGGRVELSLKITREEMQAGQSDPRSSQDSPPEQLGACTSETFIWQSG